MNIAEASALRYSAVDIVAMYLHAEWGGILTPQVSHFPGGPAAQLELSTPGVFYVRAADLATRTAAAHGVELHQICDVGAGTGRTTYELSLRLPLTTRFTMVEPSEAFCAWAHRLLIEPARDLPIPVPGLVGRPTSALVPADRLPRITHDVKIYPQDAAGFAEHGETFDLVTCFNVLDRVPDPRTLVDDLARLVRPGGLLVLACPFDYDTQYSPPEVWVHDQRELLRPEQFEVVAVEELPYTFQQHGRAFNWYLSQVVVARRR